MNNLSFTEFPAPFRWSSIQVPDGLLGRARGVGLTRLLVTGLFVLALPLSATGLRWEELAAKGQTVPDYPAGGTFTTFRDQPLIGNGRTLYRGQMSTPSSGTVDGLWYRNDTTGADVLAMAGRELPLGAPAGSTFFSTTFSSVGYGANAAVAASGYLTGGPVTSSNDRVVLAPEFPASGSRIRAREGDGAGFGGWSLERRSARARWTPRRSCRWQAG